MRAGIAVHKGVACACDTSSESLEILGSPLVNDSTGGSNWCLKQCRQCGTFFEWRHEYTYLVNGASEDDTYVTRLTGGAAVREALRTMFSRLQHKGGTAQDEARAARLPDVFDPTTSVPLEQAGAAFPSYPRMEALRTSEAVTEGELTALLAAHARFVANGGAGAGWRTALTGADLATTLVFACYGCPAEDQAQLSLHRLPPRSQRLELASANLLAVSCVQGNLDGANLDGAMLVLADLIGTSLRGATLSRADCTGARMAECDLRDADLRGTDFERADLSGADLRGARIDGASFLGTRTLGIRR